MRHRFVILDTVHCINGMTGCLRPSWIVPYAISVKTLEIYLRDFDTYHDKYETVKNTTLNIPENVIDLSFNKLLS